MTWQPFAPIAGAVALFAVDVGLRLWTPFDPNAFSDNIQLGVLTAVAAATAVTVGFTLVLINSVATTTSYLFARALIIAPTLWTFLAIAVPTILLSVFQIAVHPTSQWEQALVMTSCALSLFALVAYVVAVPNEIDPKELSRRLLHRPPWGDPWSWWEQFATRAIKDAAWEGILSGRLTGFDTMSIVFDELDQHAFAEKPPDRRAHRGRGRSAKEHTPATRPARRVERKEPRPDSGLVERDVRRAVKLVRDCYHWAGTSAVQAEIRAWGQVRWIRAIYRAKHFEDAMRSGDPRTTDRTIRETVAAATSAGQIVRELHGTEPAFGLAAIKESLALEDLDSIDSLGVHPTERALNFLFNFHLVSEAGGATWYRDPDLGQPLPRAFVAGFVTLEAPYRAFLPPDFVEMMQNRSKEEEGGASPRPASVS